MQEKKSGKEKKLDVINASKLIIADFTTGVAELKAVVLAFCLFVLFLHLLLLYLRCVCVGGGD